MPNALTIPLADKRNQDGSRRFQLRDPACFNMFVRSYVKHDCILLLVGFCVLEAHLITIFYALLSTGLRVCLLISTYTKKT